MTTAQELVDLAARCERAAGADRELDGDIADAALGPVKAPYRRGRCENYTSSLDAAMALVPEGLRFEVTTTGFKPGAIVCGNRFTSASASTPALALTAAALRARAAVIQAASG